MGQVLHGSATSSPVITTLFNPNKKGSICLFAQDQELLSTPAFRGGCPQVSVNR